MLRTTIAAALLACIGTAATACPPMEETVAIVIEEAGFDRTVRVLRMDRGGEEVFGLLTDAAGSQWYLLAIPGDGTACIIGQGDGLRAFLTARGEPA